MYLKNKHDPGTGSKEMDMISDWKRIGVSWMCFVTPLN
jgi:hypothetical protein